MKSKHIQNPVEYITWDILRTLPNYVYIANLDTQYIQSFPILRTQVCQLLMYQLLFRTINLLLHPLLFFKEWAITTLFLTMGYFLPILFLATSQCISATGLLPTGQIYVCGIIVERSHDIFLEYSEKVPYEIPRKIPK